MAKNTLVAVGGSGQSAAIAYLRMATLSGMPPEELPNIYVIDADVKDRQGASAKPSLYSSLKVLFTQLVQGVSDTNKPRLELIYPYSTQSYDLMSSSTVFADYIINKGGTKQDMAFVTDALFSKKLNNRNNAHVLSEQDVPLSKGFMARPNVGATTFFDKLHQGKGTLEGALTRLQDAVANGHNQAVTVVVGSSFGGTGSGVAPSLAQQLAEWASRAGQNPRIGLFMTLPWFNPNGEKTQPDATPTHGSTDVQKKNTAGGLRYYATSEAFKSFDVFVADYAGQIQIRNDDSNSEQPEYEHVFNILLASQIQNYFIKKTYDTNFISRSSAYTFYAQKQIGSQNIQFDAANSALLSYAVNRNLKQDLQHWAHEAQSLRLALRHTALFIRNNFKLSTSSEREVPTEFASLALEVAKKDGRPSMIVPKQKWNPFGKDKAAHDIYLQIAQKLEERERQLGGSIAWLKALSNNCSELAIDEASIQDNPDHLFTKYNALKRDRSLEVASIRLFEDAFSKKDQNFLSAFESKCENGQSTLDAVAVVVEEAIRQEIRKDSSAPRTQDEQVSATENSGALNTLFIPMQVGNTGHAVNAYLQEINLNALVDDGKNRQNEMLTIHDPQHPATLNGLSHFSIPSPWGAAILEQWNQKAAVNASKTNDLSLLNHSSERLEAILWGIFNKKLMVKTIRADQVGSIAHTAVKVRDIETQSSSSEQTITVAINPINQQLIAANYPTVGWFATPSMSGELNDWWDEDNELFMRLPSETISAISRTSYEARLMKSFSLWIKQILDVHGDLGGRAAPWYEVLANTYHKLEPHISDEIIDLELPETTDTFLVQLESKQILTAPIVQVRESVNEIINNSCCEQLIVLENEVAMGKFEHQCPSSPLKSTVAGHARLLKQSGVINERNGSSYINLTYELTLPEGKFEVVRKGRIVNLDVQQVIWPNFKADDWNLYFAGSTATTNTDLINQTAPKYAYRLYTQLGNTHKEVRYIISDSDELQSFKDPLFFDRNYELFGRPDLLVLLEKDQNTGVYQEVGSIYTGLNTTENTDHLQFKLGLDFGTSHSCVVALDRSDRKINMIDFTRPVDRVGFLKHVIKTPMGDDMLLDEFRFIAPFAAIMQEKELDRNVLPTEFRFNQALSMLKPLKDIDAGIRYLTILPMQFEKATAERSIKETGALGDFKWGTNTKNSSLTGTSYEGAESELSVQYIRQILRIALAMLRYKGYTKLISFRATYPEAFNTSRINIFANDLEGIWKQLLKETGIQCDQDIIASTLLKLKDFSKGTDINNGQGLGALSHGLISESIGALQTTLKTSDRNLLSDKKLQIVLDMGGGSTDVAAFLNVASLGIELPKHIPTSLTDSICYAGHDVLSLLSHADVVNVLGEKTDNSNNDQQQYMRVIKMAMRNTKKVRTLQTKFEEGTLVPKVKENIRAFFDGLSEYTRQLIHSYQVQLQSLGEQDLTVGIVLLGNGWRLGNLVYTAENVETDISGLIHAMQEYLTKHLDHISGLNIVFPAGSDISVKESIAYGALLYNVEQEDVHHTGETALARNRYSFIGSTQLSNVESSFVTQQKANERRTQQALQIEELPKFPSNTEFVTRLDAVSGQDDKGLHFAKIELNQHLRNRWRSAEDEIMISPMQLFLEHVWKPTLLNDK